MTTTPLYFKTFTEEQRKKDAESGIALPDGSFPIKNRVDLADAIHDYGRADDKPAVKAHIERRARALGAEDMIPSGWEFAGDKEISHKMSQSLTNHRPTGPEVKFALSPTQRRVEGDYVIRQGKYFPCNTEVRDMNGRAFSITEAEADRLLPAAPTWTGPGCLDSTLNVMHDDTPFTTKVPGKLGGVRRYWREGPDIMAEYALHRDIDSFFEGAPLEMSSEWNPLTKIPAGGGIVVHPAVPDAVMYMQKFAKKINGDSQDVHDMAVRKGAECPGKVMFSLYPDELTAIKFMTPETLAAMQHVHDHMKENGASCDLYATKKGMYYSAPISASATEQGATSGTLPASPPSVKGGIMNGIQKLMALFTKAGVPEAEVKEALSDVHFSAEPDPATIQMAQEARNGMLQMQEQFRQDRVNEQAEIWVEEQIRGGRAMPSDRTRLMAQFSRAAHDDHRSPEMVKFSRVDGSRAEMSRLELLKADYASRSAHNLFDEVMKDPALLIAMQNQMLTRGRDGNGKPAGANKADPERVKRLAAAAMEN